MKTGGATRAARADVGVEKTSFTRTSKGWLALLAVLLVGTLASGAQAQLDESPAAPPSSQQNSASDPFGTFSAGTSETSSTGSSCAQTGLETVGTPDTHYPAGSIVPISGSGYAPGCDVVVRVTRPDATFSDATVTTDLGGNFSYDYTIPGPPYVLGTYQVDVLGMGDAVLAHTSFEDAPNVSKLFADGQGAGGTETSVFSVGHTIYSNGSLDSGTFGRIVINDGNGVNRFTSACQPEASFDVSAGNPDGPPRYTFVAADPVTTDSAHQYAYIVQQFTTLANCNAGTPTASTKTMNFWYAKATVYSDPALTIPKTDFAAGTTAYVKVEGYIDAKTDVSTTWILPSGSTACANTSGGDQPDASNITDPASPILPDPADNAAGPPSSDGLQYPPRGLPNTGGDDWNWQSNGYTPTCPAFSAANQGDWKLTLEAGSKETTTFTLFNVDATAPTVTINQASGQADPTTVSPINFTAVFSEDVTGFTGSDVSFTGSTAGGTLSATVTEIAPNDGTTYNVEVTGMTQRGTVVATIPAGGAADPAGNTNTASTSTDNSVLWDRVPTATVSLSDATPQTNDTLTATATKSDPDGDTVTLTYVWKVNNVTQQTTVTTSLTDTFNLATAGFGDKSDTVTVEVTPNDGLFNGAMVSDTAIVQNTTPTVTLGANNLSPNEGTTYTYSYSISDADGDTIASVATSCGTGTKTNATNTNTTGSFDCTFADGPASTTVSAQATDSGFQAGAGNLATQSISVQNVAPTVTLSTLNDLSVNEGSTHTYSYTISDPGTDTVTSVATSCGANGTLSNASNTNTSGSFDCTFPDGDDTSTVSAQATDSDGDAGNLATQLVTINNVAPTVPTLLTPADNSSTGDTTPTFDWSNSTDPGADTITYSIQANLGSCVFTGTNEIDQSGLATSTFTPATPLADGTYCWRVQATDSDSADSGWSATRNVTIDSAELSVTVTLAAGQDASTNDSPINFTVTFSKPVTGFTDSDVSFTGSTAGGTLVASVTGGPATYNVEVTGMTTNGAVTVSVPAGSATDAASNPNTASNAATVNWDTTSPSVTINQAAGQTDPTSSSPINFTVVFSEAVADFGNGDVSFTGSTAGGTLSASVTGGPTNYNVAVTGMTSSGTVVATIEADKAHDAAGNGNTASTSTDNTVTFTTSTTNAPPVVTMTSPTFGQLYAKPATVNLSASFTDANTTDTHTCLINWDDGTTTSGTITESGGSGTCTATHSYTAAGVYTIVVTVTDNNGGSGSAEVLIVVYDASAGFVTGGGWLNVAAGSYTANPTLAGRANFGFNAKYKKGATVPDGSTEFQFQVGNLNFHSTNYTWLVVSGYRAQFKGTGTVNGVSGYDFTLTAYDGQIAGGGGVDRFRIVIKQGATPVFDNRSGASMDMDAANPQNIAGGSIVIHKA